MAVGVLAAALMLAHARDRRVHARRGDLSRRSFLRAGVVTSVAGVLDVAVLGVATLTVPPGIRRSTGSFRLPSSSVAAIPVTRWLVDGVPSIDRAAWRVTVVADGVPREWSLAELRQWDDRQSAVLDCTGLPVGELSVQSVYRGSSTPLAEQSPPPPRRVHDVAAASRTWPGS